MYEVQILTEIMNGTELASASVSVKDKEPL